MLIKLDDQDSPYFKFKIGDKVRLKFGSTTGTIMAGNCYLDWGMSSVFYTVKIRYGPTQKFREGDIALFQIKMSY